jgi:hypothetical protein
MYPQEMVRNFLLIRITEDTGNCPVSHHTENRQLASNFLSFARLCTGNHEPEPYLHSTKNDGFPGVSRGCAPIYGANSEAGAEISHGCAKRGNRIPRKP